MNAQDVGFNTIERFRSESGGVLLVDKPEGWTSFDVVKKIRGMFRLKKVGHAGTLDPLATGLLILASERMTRKIDLFQALEKTYEGTCILGAMTTSFDADTPIIETKQIDGISKETLTEATRSFVGSIEQLPPMYSAVKVQGQRLYKLARKGVEIERSPRTVTISEFTILDAQLPEVTFRVRCSKGTYVRTLIHDLGQALGCGAYLKSLQRTAIGLFHIEEAWTIERLAQYKHEGMAYASA